MVAAGEARLPAGAEHQQSCSDCSTMPTLVAFGKWDLMTGSALSNAFNGERRQQ
jgi:hypothetical protein